MTAQEAMKQTQLQGQEAEIKVLECNHVLCISTDHGTSQRVLISNYLVIGVELVIK